MKKELLILLFLIIAFSHNFILQKGIINFGEVFGFFNNIESSKLYIQSWNEYYSLGEPNKFLRTSFFTWLLRHSSGEIFQKLYYITISVIAPFLGMYILYKRLFKNKSQAIISGFVYTVSLFAIFRLGQPGHVFGYALLPYIILFYHCGLKSKKHALICGLLIYITFPQTPHIVVAGLIIILIDITYKLIKRKWKEIFNLTPIFFILIFTIFQYMWLDSIFKTFYTIERYDTLSGLIFHGRNANIPNIITLRGCGESKTVKILLDQVSIYGYAYIILSVASILLIRTKKNFFWFIILLVGIFLSKGANPPLGIINEILFVWVYPLRIFRDPTKLTIIILTSYSILIPQLIQKKKALRALILSILIIYNIPFFTGDAGGQLTPVNSPEYISRIQDIISDELDYRIYYLPINANMGTYTWYKYKDNPTAGSFPEVFYKLSKPIIIAFGYGTQTPSKEINTYVLSSENVDLQDLFLKKENVRYIIIDKNIKSEVPKVKSNVYRETLSFDGVTILNNTEFKQMRIYATNKIYQVFGDYTIYEKLLKLGVKNPILRFVNQNINHDEPIIAYNENLNDMVLDYLSANYTQNIKDLRVSREIDDWYFYDNHVPETMKGARFLNKESLYTHGNKTINIPINFKTNEKYLIFLRIIGDYSFESEILGLKRNYTSANRQLNTYWVKIFENKAYGAQNLKIRNLGKRIVIDTIVVIPEKVFNKTKIEFKNKTILWIFSKEFENEINEKDLINCSIEQINNITLCNPGINLKDLNSEIYFVNYSKISQTEYRIKGINNNSKYLIFTDTYNQHWLLNGKKPYVVDGFANAYEIENVNETEYTIYYELEGLYQFFNVLTIIIFVFTILLTIRELKSFDIK